MDSLLFYNKYKENKNAGYLRHAEGSIPLQVLIATDSSYTSDIYIVVQNIMSNIHYH